MSSQWVSPKAGHLSFLPLAFYLIPWLCSTVATGVSNFSACLMTSSGGHVQRKRFRILKTHSATLQEDLGGTPVILSLPHLAKGSLEITKPLCIKGPWRSQSNLCVFQMRHQSQSWPHLFRVSAGGRQIHIWTPGPWQPAHCSLDPPRPTCLVPVHSNNPAKKWVTHLRRSRL